MIGKDRKAPKSMEGIGQFKQVSLIFLHFPTKVSESIGKYRGVPENTKKHREVLGSKETYRVLFNTPQYFLIPSDTF